MYSRLEETQTGKGFRLTPPPLTSRTMCMVLMVGPNPHFPICRLSKITFFFAGYLRYAFWKQLFYYLAAPPMYDQLLRTYEGDEDALGQNLMGMYEEVTGDLYHNMTAYEAFLSLDSALQWLTIGPIYSVVLGVEESVGK